MSAVKFTVNGTEYTVDNTEENVALSTFLRNTAKLTGTKTMCHEGGCGACIVAVSALHPVTNEPETFAVNSCLVTVLSCHGWAISTVEGIGDRKGYHQIQTRLSGMNATQCGFCSPGWVMNMYSLAGANPDGLTMKQVESSFGGNMCRCTGYRPILDTMKSFSIDADPALKQKVLDIEELCKDKMCAKSNLICTKSCKDYTKEGTCSAGMERPICQMVKEAKMIEIDGNSTKWFKAYAIDDIFDVFTKEGIDSYTLVAGNTAKGVFRSSGSSNVTIDVSSVVELRSYEMTEDALELGGGMSLNEIMKLFENFGNSNPKYKYLSQMYRHLDLVAHVPVRNIGTIAGNLALKKQNPSFQSDLFVMFQAVGATLTIVSSTQTSTVSPVEYMSLDMKGKIIKTINLAPLTDDHVFQSYKIMPRGQNAHAMVNAAFLFKFNSTKTLVDEANIVYGGINPEFNNATVTENFLTGKNLFDSNVFKQAIQTLNEELEPDVSPPEPSPEYRKKLAVGLFYKCVLHISSPANLDPRIVSGGDEFDRPVSKGTQEFDTKPENYPLNQPILKAEGLAQCAGEAEYVNDIPTQNGELQASFVLTTEYSGTIDTIDVTAALAVDGVHAVLTAKDIVGNNSFAYMMGDPEEVLCSGKVLYNGQPLAIVVADRTDIAMRAVRLVKVTYKDLSTDPPVLNIRQALKAKDADRRIIKNKKTSSAKTKGKNVRKVIAGSFDIFGQYHYTMETQICLCVPIEDGMDVYSATQWMDLINVSVAEALKIPVNCVNVKVRRLGGGYGGKISRCSQVATACAIAANNLNKPVRFVLPFDVNMMSVGKRNPYSNDYEVGVDDDGKIQYLNSRFYEDDGCSSNDSIAEYLDYYLHNCYDFSTWTAEGSGVLTDTASNTPCRAPGTTESVAGIENIMEHIAVETGKDPIEVRLANLGEDSEIMKELIPYWRTETNYDQRLADIKEYNSNNRWRKRGISLTPLKFPVDYYGNFASLVSIYQADGTVAVSHGGIEMGQGLNTKVAQVCAYTLGISYSMVKVKPSNNLTSPNSIMSGGSITSESCAFATIKACEILIERLKPIKETMINPTWVQLIQKAYDSRVNLTAHYMFTVPDVTPYFVWGVTVAEVEVDMLTGNHQILRVDILEDTGESLSPLIDVGQVEGGYVMGLGYYTSEQLVYDEKTGALLSNRAWNYKIPGAKDIPVDFRVKFLRNSPNPVGVLRSKATGEPPLNMSIGIVFALRQAITAAREEIGLPTDEWYNLDIPLTTEHIIKGTSSSVDEFQI